VVNGAKDDDKRYRPSKKLDRGGPKDDSWKNKDVRSYNEGDLDNLYEQWEKDEEEIPIDELPLYDVEPPPINMGKVNVKDPDSILIEGKRYRNLMFFAKVAGNPSRKETERISARWESGLFNAHIQIKRYVIEDDQILIQLDDGSHAVQIRDYLVTQDDCWEVTLESKTYDGKAKLEKNKYSPLTKDQVKEAKQAEEDRKAQIAQLKEERRLKEEAKKAKKAKKEKNKKAKQEKKDEL